MNWNFDLDPDSLWLYILATALSTIGVVIMFRESRERKRVMDEAKRIAEEEAEAAKKARAPVKKKKR